jgi:hypothetical protein
VTAFSIIAALACAGAGAESAGVGPNGPGAPESGLRFSVEGGYMVRTGIEGTSSTPADEDKRYRPYGVAAGFSALYRLNPELAVTLRTGVARIRDHEAEAGGPYPEDPYPGEPIVYTRFELTQVPLTVGIRFGIPAHGGGWLGATAGVGGHLSWVHEKFITDDHPDAVKVRDAEFAVALGGYAGLAAEWPLASGKRVALEVRYVKSMTSFDRLNYSGDGVQILAGVSWSPGGRARPAAGPASAPGEAGAAAR